MLRRSKIIELFINTSPFHPFTLSPFHLFSLFILLCFSFSCYAQEDPPQPSLNDIFAADECGEQPNTLDDYSMPYAFSNVEVVEVSSGNSVVVRLANKTLKTVRMAGLNAPDMKTNEGKAAQKYLSDLVFGKRVFVLQYEDTSADKMEGVIALAGSYTDVNLLIVKSGLVRYQESKFLSDYDNCIYRATAEQIIKSK